MIEDISASDIANEISMIRSAYKGTFLIVEGITDSRLYAKFTDPEHVRIMIAHSKDNVRRAVAECLRRRDNAVVGIADKDLDGMTGRRCEEPVFETDRRDMESTIMCSPAFHDVLTEYADIESLQRFESRNGPVADTVAKAASPIGLLMYISYRKGMNLSFKDLDHASFVDGRSLSLDLMRMIGQVYAQSMNQMYSKAYVADTVRGLQKELTDPWDAVRGHDAVAIMAIGLRSSFGAYNAKYLREGELSGALRLAYSFEYFRKTELYAASEAWAAAHRTALWISRRHL